MPFSRKKIFLIFAGVSFVLGALAYGTKEYLAARELARINAERIDGGRYLAPLAYDGMWYKVPPREVHSSGITQGDIPALTNPATTSPAEVDTRIADDLGGISVEVNGEVRFYPVQIMNWHEVVHDTLGGESLLVYYAPLSGAASVYKLPEGKRFVVSGREYNNDVFLAEEGTPTLWSGIFGSPVVAQDQDTLKQPALERISSTFMTWKEWKKLYEDRGTVLAFETGHTRDYTRHPYGNYEKSPGVYFPVNRSYIPVRAKEPAYVVELLSEEAYGLFIDTPLLLDTTPSIVAKGDLCAVAFRANTDSYATVFDCRVDGELYTFSRKDAETFVDQETGSTWNAYGRAVSGHMRNSQLTVLPTVRLYTFAADAMFPQAVIAGEEFIFEKEEISTDAVDAAGGTMIEGEQTNGATIEVLPNE